MGDNCCCKFIRQTLQQLLVFWILPDSAGIAIRYGLNDPGIDSRRRAIFSAPVHTGSLLYNAYRDFFPVVKRPEPDVKHPPISGAEVKERVEVYLYSPSGSSWSVVEQTLPLPFTTYITRTSRLSCCTQVASIVGRGNVTCWPLNVSRLVIYTGRNIQEKYWLLLRSDVCTAMVVPDVDRETDVS
jgi:hypothetical protein